MIHFIGGTKLSIKNISLHKKHVYFNFITYFELFLYLVVAISFIYYLINGNVHKTLQPVIVALILIGFKLFIKITGLELHPILEISIITFIFMAMFLTYEFNFYHIIPLYDKLLHSFSGILFFFIGLTIFKQINRNEKNIQISPITVVLFCLFFSLSIAGSWEIFEFASDKLHGSNMQNGSLNDTMGDIICATTTATLTGSFVYSRIRKHDANYIFKYLTKHKQI